MEALGHNYNPFNLLEGGGFENDDGFHQNLVDWSLPTIHDQNKMGYMDTIVAMAKKMGYMDTTVAKAKKLIKMGFVKYFMKVPNKLFHLFQQKFQI